MQIEEYINSLNIDMTENEEKIIALMQENELSISMYFLIMKIIKRREDIERYEYRKKMYIIQKRCTVHHVQKMAEEMGIKFDGKHIQNYLSTQLEKLDQKYQDVLS